MEIGTIASSIHKLLKFKHQGEVITIKADHQMDLGISWELVLLELYSERPPDGRFDHDHWYKEAPNHQGFLDARGVVQEYTQQYYSSLLCHNQAENPRAEAFVKPEQEVILLAQDKLARINDLEDLLPIYDEYLYSNWYDIEATLNSYCQNLHSISSSLCNN